MAAAAAAGGVSVVASWSSSSYLSAIAVAEPGLQSRHRCRRRRPILKSQQLSSTRRSVVYSQADREDRQPDEGQGGPGVDWDKAWSSFKGDVSDVKKKTTGFKFPNMEQYVDRPSAPPRFAKSKQDEARRAEQMALDFWTSKGFTIIGAGILVLIVVMLFIIGPPPHR
eukprot:jgi/Chlat1/7805/Chrsp66S07267